MTTDTAAALRLLGITDDEITAMKNRWPAGVPKDCSKWNWYDERCLPIFAANCVCSENTQEIAELDYLDRLEDVETEDYLRQQLREAR